jgi:transcriptional regulator with XRE-family HTH domain
MFFASGPKARKIYEPGYPMDDSEFISLKPINLCLMDDMRSEKRLRLSQNLRFHRKRKKAALSTVARELKIYQSTLHDWENEVLPKGLVALLRLSDYYGISLTELLFGSNERLVHQIILNGTFAVNISQIMMENEEDEKKHPSRRRR